MSGRGRRGITEPMIVARGLVTQILDKNPPSHNQLVDNQLVHEYPGLGISNERRGMC